MNELAHTYWQNILVQLWKLHGQQNGNRWHYATLPGSMASYGKCIQTCTFKNKHANLLTYLANGRVYTLENGFQGEYYMPGSLFLKPSLLHIVTKKLPEWARTKTWLCVLSIVQLCVWVTMVICLRSVKSSLPSLYPQHHWCDKLLQALSHFYVLQATESWVIAWEQGYCVATLIHCIVSCELA